MTAPALFGQTLGEESGPEQFDRGEIAGMRTAAWILFSNAALTILAALFGSADATAIQIPIEILLGVQLYRLRHSWRAWTMLRAAAGVVLGGLALTFGVVATPAATVLLGLGGIFYSAALLLLLYSRPTMQRVYIGRAAFGLSALLLFAGGAWMEVSRARALPSDTSADDGADLTDRSENELSVAVIGGSNVILAGPTGGKLASEDLFSVGHFVEGAGKPWLIVGHWPERRRPSDWPVDVFFEPDVTAPGLRAGYARALIGSDGFKPKPNSATGQVSEDAVRYVQVLVDSEHPTFVAGEFAFNRPFKIGAANGVDGLKPDDIITIARLVRSSPMGRHAPVKGHWSIDDMARTGPNKVQVRLLDPDAFTRSGQEVVVSEVEGAWQVCKVSLWGI
jgi:hypothetical protein